MSYLIGIDIGTSGTKTVLFDEKGDTVSSCTLGYEMAQPKMGWAEQNPDDWWNATYKGIYSVMAQSNINKNDVKGIGLSGQMHGAVLLDKNGDVLRSAIIWCDQRSSRECEQITDIMGRDRLVEIAANPAITGFTAPKVLWVKNNQPHIFDKIAHLLLPKDYIRYKLTGEFATEVSDASGTLLLNIRERNWSKELIEKLGFETAWMPKVYESQFVSGRLTKKAADLTGLNEGTSVVGGGGDQAAGAVGNGIVKEGMVSSTIGTSGVVFAYTDKVTIDPKGRVHTFCHAIPGTWHVMGVTQGAGLSLKWFRDNFGSDEKALGAFTGTDPYEYISSEAAKADPGSDGLIFLPYMMGERTPHLDPFAKGVFFGLTAKHGRNEFIRSIMEGVVFSLRDCLEIIKGMNIPVSEVRASGGGARSDLWRQMQSDIFSKDIVTINSKEGPALGAALLAGVGTGVYSSVEQACENAIKKVDAISPEYKNMAIYEKNYKLYRELYPLLKDKFRI